MRAGAFRASLLVGLAMSVAVAAGLSPAAGAAHASPEIHAHRGGPIETVEGHPRPAWAETSLPAYREAARRGFVLELDVKLSSDGVPVVIHDARLDRTTDCEGLVAETPIAQLRRCRIDVLGTAGSVRPAPRGRRPALPTLSSALRVAKRGGASVNLEIKNIPTEPDFDASPAFAERVLDAVRRSAIPPSRVIVQSFWPANLDVAKRMLPGAQTALLTLRELNAGGPALAKARGYDWVSPAWPVGAGFVSAAHALGLRVVPYTLDSAAELRGAVEAGVDAVITNDPRLARRIVRLASAPRPRMPPPPSRAECRASNAPRNMAPIVSTVRFSNRRARSRSPRVFAMQPLQELRHVETHESFRTKIECMIRRFVVPRLARGRPNVVAFNEDIGLMTMATGGRGALTRRIFGDPALAPSCEPLGVPCGVLGALAAIRTSYTREIAAYTARFPLGGPIGMSFVAATDTFARGWMQTFSDMARRYGVHMIGSNIQAPFRESRDPAEIATFSDPGLPRPKSVFVATEPNAYNEGFIWAPRDVRREGPVMMRNVVARNKKVPVTSLEETIEVAEPPRSGPDAVENLRPYRLPGTPARLGFARSLPAFVYGHGIGEPPPRVDPCSDTGEYYMRCLDRLKTNVVIQDEANPARWAGPSGEGNWQPLEWMRSTWRATADRSVGFLYNVTPHLVGNLADLVFDGQTAITQRGLRGRRCTYVGNSRLEAEDPAYLHPYAGRKRGFVALVPWVTPDAPRDELRDTARRLAPGSRDALENDYLETAVVADLPFPPRPRRLACAGSRGPG